MYPSRPPRSRYLRALQRAHLARIAAVGAALAMPMACSDSDAETFAEATVATTTTTAAPATSPTSAAPAASVPVATTPAETTPPTAGSTSAGAVPAGAEMQIDFTYTPESTAGRVQNPYIAVWIEDTDGNLVRTIAVWYQSSIPGPRWLGELLGWNAASGGATDASFTGATRTPGTYSLVWDGLDEDGNAVPAGDYVVWIESAREHGPYNITNTTVTLESGSTAVLPDAGELTGATVTALV